MKVLLLSANRLTVPYPVYPIGLDYVAASISDRHEVKIADMNGLKDYEALALIIHDFNPDITGISLRNIDNTDSSSPEGFIAEYRALVEEIRKHTSSPIILGGSGFTIFPARIMKSTGADYGITGEGERLSLLLDALSEGKDPGSVPGVILQGAADSIPPPLGYAFKRTSPSGAEHSSFYLTHGSMLNIQSKRGCPFKCIYCTYPHIEGSRQRFIDPEEVAANAVSLQEAGAKYFFITDSAFNSDYDHSSRVAEAFIKAGLSIPWGGFFAPTEPPEGYYRLMKRAGLSHVEFGTESMSNTVLSSYRKPFKADTVFKAHSEALDAGLYIAHYLLLGGPGETFKTLEETLDSAGMLKKSVIFFFCGMRIYPYTALYDLSLEQGQIGPDADLLEPVFYISKDITPDEILSKVHERSGGRPDWVIGSGGEKTARIVSKMYRRGHTGPLWELLIK